MPRSLKGTINTTGKGSNNICSAYQVFVFDRSRFLSYFEAERQQCYLLFSYFTCAPLMSFRKVNVQKTIDDIN